MYWLGCLTGAVVIGAIWVGVSWYKNRKAQIKEKVVNGIKKI